MKPIKERDLEILRERKSGMLLREIGERHSLSPERVRSICRTVSMKLLRQKFNELAQDPSVTEENALEYYHENHHSVLKYPDETIRFTWQHIRQKYENMRT